MTISNKRSPKLYIYGKHAAMEALTSEKKGLVKKVFLAAGVQDQELKNLIRKAGVSIANLSTGNLSDSKEIANVSHQGVVCLIDESKLTISYKDFIENFKTNKNSLFVILGELHDPQNIGAIIRSSAAFGAAGILLPEHNQGRVTGAVIKVSAGMAFRMPLISIGNINSTIKDLKERGFWVYGFDMIGKRKLQEEAFDAPTVFVFGNESAGVREKTLQSCDEILSIPISQKCESLNVAASAAIALYAWSTTR